jgi:cell division protein FtsB
MQEAFSFVIVEMNWQYRSVLIVLVLIFLGLQYRLWVGEGSWAEVRALKQQIANQERQLDRLRQTNQVLQIEVDSLKNDASAIEAKARNDLGLIKKDETYFQIVNEEGYKRD